ncbi:MAG: phasin family protein [Methyloceanibacter sp.]|jgi:hypothetical protein
MAEELKNIGEDYQRLSKEGFDAAARSFGEVNKGFQAIASEATDYSKKVFDDVIRAWEQLLGAKSMDRAFEIQSQYAKKAYDNHIAEMSKLGEMYVSLARNAYKPVEQAAARKVT